MATFTSGKVEAVGGGKGYVVVTITKKDKTTGHIKVDFKLDGYFMIQADISKSDWSYSSNTVSGSLSAPPGYIGDASYKPDWHIRTLEKDFALPKSNSTETLNFSFSSNLPYNPGIGFPANNYSYSGSVSVTYPAGEYHTHPKDLKVKTLTSTTNSITTTTGWTSGTGADAKVNVKLNGSNTKTLDDWDIPATWTGLTPNANYSLSYELWDVATDGTEHRNLETTSRSIWTKIATPTISASSSTTSITVSPGLNGNAGNGVWQYKIDSGGWGTSATFSGLTPNTYHTVYTKLVNTSNTSDSESDPASTSLWTYPALNAPTLSLPAGSEHNSIKVTANVNGGTSNAQYRYRINNGSWSAWTTSNTHTFTGLSGNTSYTIGVQMRNSSSGLVSSEVTGSIRTWHNPLTGLKVNLVNRWFWYLLINSSYSYTGTISKFEFDIGGQGYQNKGTTNSHSRGTTSPTGSNPLKYNATYTCKVRVTDNHGRQYTAQASFTTLDARCSYVNDNLVEVTVVKPDGNSVLITPNLCTVIKPDGTEVNMNKIINNDNRLVYQ